MPHNAAHLVLVVPHLLFIFTRLHCLSKGVTALVPLRNPKTEISNSYVTGQPLPKAFHCAAIRFCWCAFSNF